MKELRSALASFCRRRVICTLPANTSFLPFVVLLVFLRVDAFLAALSAICFFNLAAASCLL